MQKIRVPAGANAMSYEYANETFRLGFRGGVMIMVIPHKKDKALYSPTSASEKNELLREEPRKPPFLTGSDKLIGSHIYAVASSSRITTASCSELAPRSRAFRRLVSTRERS